MEVSADRNKGCEDNGSVCSRSSSSSKAGLAVIMAKAKAEAAQARAAHSKREIELKVEQARIQATLEALNDEKEKDAAIAEANTLEAGLSDMDIEVRSKVSSPVPKDSQYQRTAAYVSEQASMHTDNQPTTMEALSLQVSSLLKQKTSKSRRSMQHQYCPIHTTSPKPKLFLLAIIHLSSSLKLLSLMEHYHLRALVSSHHSLCISLLMEHPMMLVMAIPRP